MKRRQPHTKDKLEYLKTQGYKVVVMQECDYQKSTLDVYLPSNYQHHKSDLGEAQILEDVRKGNLYGMVEVDIEVPKCLWEHFSEMSPLFCTCAFPFEVIVFNMGLLRACSGSCHLP